MTTFLLRLGTGRYFFLFCLLVCVFYCQGCALTDATGITEVARDERGQPKRDADGNLIRKPGPLATAGGMFSPWITAAVGAGISITAAVAAERKRRNSGSVLRGIISGIDALPAETKQMALDAIGSKLKRGTPLGDLGRKYIDGAKRKLKKLESKARKLGLKADEKVRKIMDG